MADPFTIAAGVTSAVSGAASIASGFSRRAALKSQAKSAEFEAQIAELRADQASADRRAELNDTIAAINTIRAARGVSGDSPNAAAIRAQARRESRRAESREVLGERLGAVSKRTETSSLRRAAPFAVIGGIAEGLPSFASAASRFDKGFGGG